MFVAGGVYLLGIAAALLVMAALFGGVLDFVHHRVLWPWRAAMMSDGQRQVRERLMQQSWWFSEDEATMEMLQDIARDAQDISHVRDKWRAARARREGDA